MLTKRRLFSMILIGCLLVYSFKIKAQVLEPLPENRHQVYHNLGYDYNIISINLGYARYLENFRTSIFLDISQGSSLIGSGNFNIRSGLRTWNGSFGDFNLNTSLAVLYTRASNKTASYNGLGLDFGIKPGFRIRRMSVGVDVQYTTYFSTHIKHTDYWREYFFEDVKDGWYNLRTNNWRLGIYLARTLGKNQRCEINLRGGYQTSGEFDKLLPGIYLIMGTNIQIK